MNETSSRVVTLVLAILALAGMVLGIAALSSALSTRNAVGEIKLQVENEIAVAEQLESDLRALHSKVQTSFSIMGKELQAIRVQASGVTAPVAGESAAPRAEPAGTDGAARPAAAGQGVPAGAAYHTVVAGDLMGRIARKYDTTLVDLEKLNPGLDPSLIRVGQKIRVK